MANRLNRFATDDRDALKYTPMARMTPAFGTSFPASARSPTVCRPPAILKAQ